MYVWVQAGKIEFKDASCLLHCCCCCNHCSCSSSYFRSFSFASFSSSQPLLLLLLLLFIIIIFISFFCIGTNVAWAWFSGFSILVNQFSTESDELRNKEEWKMVPLFVVHDCLEKRKKFHVYLIFTRLHCLFVCETLCVCRLNRS